MHYIYSTRVRYSFAEVKTERTKIKDSNEFNVLYGTILITCTDWIVHLYLRDLAHTTIFCTCRGHCSDCHLVDLIRVGWSL